MEAPAGLVGIRTKCIQGKVKQVIFRKVPAFAAYQDETIDIQHLGRVRIDVAYGGMFYVIADADQFGLSILPEEGKIVRIGEMIKAAAKEQLLVVHPAQEGFSGVTISQLSAPPTAPGAHRKNAVIVSTGQLDWDRPATWNGTIDRSPCGMGTNAKMTVLHAKGQLRLNQDFCHEGILGTIFTGRLVEETQVCLYRAVVPTISGQAWIIGMGGYIIHPEDPFPEGSTLGDIWG